MMHREAIRAFLVAAETECVTTAAGHVMPNQAIQNAGRIFCSQSYSGMAHLLREIVGGQAVMLPDRSMLENAEIGADVAKYFAVGQHSADERLRALQLELEDARLEELQGLVLRQPRLGRDRLRDVQHLTLQKLDARACLREIGFRLPESRAQVRVTPALVERASTAAPALTPA